MSNNDKLGNANFQEAIQILSSFGDNINLQSLDPNMLNSLLQYTSLIKAAKESQNNENVMENFLNQLNTSKGIEIQKEENNTERKNPELQYTGRETLSETNEKSARNKDINDFNDNANVLSFSNIKSKILEPTFHKTFK